MQLSTIKDFTTATAEIAVAEVVAKVQDGQLYAGEAYALAKLLETIAEGIRKNVPLHEDWQGRGATVKLGTTTSYDYSATARIAELEGQLKQIKAEAQRLAKANTTANGAVMLEGGEFVDVAPAKPTYSTRITVTLAKL